MLIGVMESKVSQAETTLQPSPGCGKPRGQPSANIQTRAESGSYNKNVGGCPPSFPHHRSSPGSSWTPEWYSRTLFLQELLPQVGRGHGHLSTY